MFSAAKQNRTADLILTKDALYRLSHSSVKLTLRHYIFIPMVRQLFFLYIIGIYHRHHKSRSLKPYEFLNIVVIYDPVIHIYRSVLRILPCFITALSRKVAG